MTSGSLVLHADELPITTELVRALVDRDFPKYASMQIARLGTSGSSNALFRLGDRYLVRLPRQPGGSLAIEKEVRWLPQFAASLPVAVPEVLDVGQPGFGYPERWSVLRWVAGTSPGRPLGGTENQLAPLAGDLARVVGAIRSMDVPAELVGTPSLTGYRGGSLVARNAETRSVIERCEALVGLDVDLLGVRNAWDTAMQLGDAPPSAARWFHGDLFSENLLVRDGRLAAVLDFGGVGIGDPTVDLVVAWDALDHEGRAAFRRDLAIDDETWRRARAWALSIALVVLPYYWQTMPSRCAQRVALISAVLEDRP